MNRLQTELHRLYLPVGDGAALVDAAGLARALVMEMTRPPDWTVLGRVWHGVQHDLGMPAPGIAVSGEDALQLWFSLAVAVPVALGRAFLEAVRDRYLAEVDPVRVRLWPASGDTQVRLVPQRHEPSGNWSAFVASDLAPVFADAPYLDLPPSEEGQASLLGGLAVTPAEVFEAAERRLGLAPVAPMPMRVAAPAPATLAPPPPASPVEDPRHFLQRVMGDESVELRWRIEAAKALLPHAAEHRLQREE